MAYTISDVKANHAISVTFAVDTYTVTASLSGSHGTVSPPTQTRSYSESATITITPDPGYHIASITDNGIPVAPVTPYVITNLKTDHDVVVSFSLDTYSITASVSGNHGSVSPSSQTIPKGSPASIAITPDAGYHIASITDNSIPQAVANPYVIPGITADHSVVVTFSPNYTLSVVKTGSGAGTVTGAPKGIACGSVRYAGLMGIAALCPSYGFDGRRRALPGVR